MALLEVCAVSKSFGGVNALNDVHFSMSEGEIVGVIGPNGAGKTSFFNCLTGLLSPDKGTIFFQNRKYALHRLSPEKIAESGLCRTFQNLRIFNNMTVLENVSIGFHSRVKSGLLDALIRTRRFHIEEKRIFTQSFELLNFIGLAAQANELAGNLAYGNQKRLEIARALACGPKLLLLDEPVAGMNSTEKQEIAALVRRIRASGVSILLIEHDMKVVMPLSDRVVVMDEGQKIAEGKPEEVQGNPRVIQAYLGEG